jgi:hypothetical protein
MFDPNPVDDFNSNVNPEEDLHRGWLTRCTPLDTVAPKSEPAQPASAWGITDDKCPF